jgi:hypothetical protein
MQITYTIHNNFDHCSVDYESTSYTYNKLREILKEKGKKYIKANELVNKSISLSLDNQFNDFDKSNLSEQELEGFEYWKNQSKAKSWFSSQRNKRRKGKLKQHQIEMLNRIGMLWNPREDEWENNYNKFRKNILVDVIIKMRNEEYGLSASKLCDLRLQEVWVEQQRDLFENNKLDQENLTRLKAIEFPFNPTREEFSDISIYELVRLVYTIKTLKEQLVESRNHFVRFYDLPKEYKNVKSKINLKESIYKSRNKISQLQKEKKSLKFDLKQKIIFDDLKINGFSDAESKSKNDFIEQIDRYSKQKPLTWNEKQNHEVDGKAYDRGSSFYFDIYSPKYIELSNFLLNHYNYQEKIDGITYLTSVNFLYSDEIKEYASKKIIFILDEFLLRSGRLNHKKSFISVSFLIKFYKKKKNIEELIILKNIIKQHEILTLIYSDKLNIILSKLLK